MCSGRRGRSQADHTTDMLLPTLIHRSAWKGDSPKSRGTILHNLESAVALERAHDVVEHGSQH